MLRPLHPHRAVAVTAVVMGLVVASSSACSAVWNFGEASLGDSNGSKDGFLRDAGLDGSSLCELVTPFDAPVALDELNTPASQVAPRLTDDELTIFYVDDGSPVVAERPTRDDRFGQPVPIPGLARDAIDPMVSSDGLRAYFASPTGGTLDIWLAQRRDRTAAFGAATVLASSMNATLSNEFQPFESSGGLWFVSDRRGNRDVWFAEHVAGGVGVPTLVSSSTTDDDGWPTISPDHLGLYFSAWNGEARGGNAIYLTTRPRLEAAFSDRRRVVELDGDGADLPGWLSEDRCRLYIFSDRAGSFDLFVARRHPRSVSVGSTE